MSSESLNVEGWTITKESPNKFKFVKSDQDPDHLCTAQRDGSDFQYHYEGRPKEDHPLTPVKIIADRYMVGLVVAKQAEEGKAPIIFASVPEQVLEDFAAMTKIIAENSQFFDQHDYGYL